MEFVIIYPVFIGIALAMSQYAHSRGHSVRVWFLIGLLLPIVSIPFIFFLKQKEKENKGFHALVNKEHGDKVLFKKEK